MRPRRTHSEFLELISGRKITVLGDYKNANTKISFRCDVCLNEWNTTPRHILRGQGCPPCERAISGINSRKKNKILCDHGDWVEVDVSSNKYPDAIMKIDKCDLRLLTHGVCISGYGYPTMHVGKSNAYIHRLIMDGVEEVDHKNGDRLDNRRLNLRSCSRSQNIMNKGTLKNNKSGTTGVFWASHQEKWVAKICHNGKVIGLGYYDNIDFAIGARKQAEKKYFGEFAP